jgi:photosystem II stability/assembly factor-like uncharacterized protein
VSGNGESSGYQEAVIKFMLNFKRSLHMKHLLRLLFIMMLGCSPMMATAQWQHIHQFQNTVSELQFHNINKGAVISGYDWLLVTDDGGLTFDTVLYRPAGVHSLNILDSSNIYIVSDNKLLHSADFGVNWDSVILPQPMTWIKLLNDTLIFGKVANTLYKSVNGGVTWQPILSGLSTIWFNYYFPHADTGYVQANDTIYLTTNGGSTWSIMTAPSGYGASFITDSIWYGAKGSANDSLTIIKTTDRGLTWSGPIWQGYNFHGYNHVNFVNENVGYITGFFLLQATTDGGQTWMMHYADSPPSSFCDYVLGSQFLNADTGFAWDACGLLYRTTHGTDTSIFVTSLFVYETLLYEPCGRSTLTVTLSNAPSDTLVVHFDAMYGTAANGVDFVHIPDSVIFLPGMQHAEIPIVVISDALTEGPEYFTIVIHNTLYSDTATFWIRDSVNNPFTYQLNHHELILCPNATSVQLNASPNGGAQPYSTIWYDTFGVLSQNASLVVQALPWHQTIFLEIADNSMCNAMLDSVKVYCFDSCNVVIQSSYPGQVPAGVPVTYTLQHSCPTSTTNNRWLINQQVYIQNTNQLVYTWTTTGPQQVNAIVDHPCGYLTTGIAVDVITGIGGAEAQGQLQLTPIENRIWMISGERLTSSLTLRVMDMGGRVVGQQILRPEGEHLNHTLDLHHLSVGVYLIDVVSENGFRLRERIVCW